MSRAAALALAAAMATVAPSPAAGQAAKGKYLIVLQAGRSGAEGFSRATTALRTARELHDQGHAVAVVFDGVGTLWVEEGTRTQSRSKLKPLIDALTQRKIPWSVCEICSVEYMIRDRLKQRKIPLEGGQGHPSLVKWLEQSYQPLIF